MEHFSKEAFAEAKKINLAEFLQHRGVELIKDGSDYRLKEHDSLVISPDTGLWCWNSRGKLGGDNIDYLVKIEHMTTHDAVVALLGGAIDLPSYRSSFDHTPKKPKPKVPFSLPPPAADTRRVFAYLHKERKILPAIINHFIKTGDLYESEKYHDVVFVGRDENNVPRHAHKRSTITFLPANNNNRNKIASGKKKTNRWNVDRSDKRYGFSHVGQSDRVFVFEAPIDMLSYISLRVLKSHDDSWKEDSYICLFGLADNRLKHFLSTHPNIRRIVFCLDNDMDGKLEDGAPHNHGQIAEDEYINIYTARGYTARRHIPQRGKDFNDELKSKFIV